MMATYCCDCCRDCICVDDDDWVVVVVVLVIGYMLGVGCVIIIRVLLICF